MKPVYNLSLKWQTMVLILLWSFPVSAGFLRFEGIQKNDNAGQIPHDYIAEVALSPDNNQVYAAGFDRAGVLVFNRNRDTGVLTFLECQQNGVRQVNGLGGALRIIVSRDGRHVYAAGCWDYALAVFSREAATGKLSFVESQKVDIGGQSGLLRIRSLVSSPDGRHVYTANSNDSVAVFKREPASGKLHFLEALRKGMSGMEGLGDPTSIALSPDGLHVYVTGMGDNTLSVFSREQDTGLLRLTEIHKNGNRGVTGLERPTWVTLSPDGDYVYTAGFRADSVVVFKRNPVDGKLLFVEALRNGVGKTNGLNGVSAVTVSPDGKYLYAAGELENALVMFSRDGETGKLTFMEAYRNGDGGVQGLFSPGYVTTSSDGKHIYVSGKSKNLLLFSTP